ncbi:unnamed protein product, partial [Effrenium voratum]
TDQSRGRKIERNGSPFETPLSGHTGQPLLEALADVTRRLLGELDAQGAANVAQAHATSAIRSERVPGALAARCVAMGSHQSNRQGLANIGRGSGKVEAASQPPTEMPGAGCMEKAAELRGQELSAMVWSFGTAQVRGAAALEVLGRFAVTLADHGPQDPANLGWGPTKSALRGDSPNGALAAAALEKIDRPTAQEPASAAQAPGVQLCEGTKLTEAAAAAAKGKNLGAQSSSGARFD